jgi:copper chaperone
MSENVHLVLNVPAISCMHCKMAIEGAVGRLDGVDTVQVDVPSKSVDVVYEEGRVSREDIEAAIEEEGYEVAGAHVFAG